MIPDKTLTHRGVAKQAIRLAQNLERHQSAQKPPHRVERRTHPFCHLLRRHGLNRNHVAHPQQRRSADDLTHAIRPREPVQTIDRVHQPESYACGILAGRPASASSVTGLPRF
jgi:hypothetical protein